MSFRGGDVIARDIHQSARACQVLLALAGIEDRALWGPQGPSRRAIWIKGYLRRVDPVRGGAAKQQAIRRPLSPIEPMTRTERIMLLVAFDFWNGSGGPSFSEVLRLAPRLVRAIAGLMEARHVDSEAIEMWIACWSPTGAG